MKRPPKPFSVEIKRSRRSPIASPSSQSDFLGRNRIDLDEGARPECVSRAPADADTFAIPAFLQSDKAPSRQLPESLARAAEQVFALKPTPRADEPSISDEPHRPRILPSLVAEASPTSEDGGGPNAQAMKPSKRRAPKAAAGLAPPQTRARRRNDTAQPARTLVSETNAAPAQEHPTKQRDRAAAPRPNGIGLSSEPAAAVANGAALEANTPPDPDRKHRASRTRILLKRGRNTAAALPAGQHWKRRLHPRSW